jgi:hypothetical protein
MKIKNLYLALKDQLPLQRAFKNFFITGNAWGMFSKKSHSLGPSRDKITYYKISSAKNAALKMNQKYNKHFSVYKCIFCDGYHIGKNKQNK